MTNLVNASLVTLFPGKSRLNKGLDEQDRLINAVLAGANRTHIGVVVLSGQDRRVSVPHQSRPNSGDLVGSDLLAISRTAKDNAESLGA